MQRGHYATITREKRDLVIQACQRGENPEDIVRMLGVKQSTAYNIWNTFCNGGRRYALPRGGAKQRKLTAPMRDFLVSIVQENPFLTLDQMRARLLAEFHGDLATVDISTISRALDGQLFTLKCPSREADVPAARNSEENREKRREFANWLVNLPPFTELVHLDETGFGVWTRRSFGRRVRGKRVHREIHT